MEVFEDFVQSVVGAVVPQVQRTQAMDVAKVCEGGLVGTCLGREGVSYAPEVSRESLAIKNPKSKEALYGALEILCTCESCVASGWFPRAGPKHAAHLFVTLG